MRSALARGARVFKVHAQVGGFDLREQALDEVWGLLADAAVPVVLHVGSGPVPRPGPTGPDKLEGVLRRHPQLPPWSLTWGRRSMPGSSPSPSGTREYTSTPRWCSPTSSRISRPSLLTCCHRLAALPDRVVLGSDFPNIPYPYAHQLEALERLGERERSFDDDWLRAVCWFNPRRLIG